MNIFSRAVHQGDRRPPGKHIPVTTPIYASASFFYEDVRTIDEVFSRETDGFAYSRYDNPTNSALEELVASLEGGAGALATASGMSALKLALEAALLERNKTVLAATALYGATVKLLQLMEPFGCETRFVDICDLEAVESALEKFAPGALLMESISNPTLRVGALDEIARLANARGVPIVIDSTFATPLVLRPLEHGASMVVHSATKYLSGHGDVLGGFVVAGPEYLPLVRSLSQICGPVMSPFDAYLAMRGIKTFPLRMERQCRNAICVAEGLRRHPRVTRVIHTSDPSHPDAEVIRRLMPEGLTGAIVSFEIQGAGRDEVFAFINRLKMIVPATSLGDVHSMLLYPAISSHRDLSPKQRERQGITDGLVRLSAGIEAPEDILADLSQALG
jgi:cystathionine gamma-synthase/methionine-gamma-lyase